MEVDEGVIDELKSGVTKLFECEAMPPHLDKRAASRLEKAKEQLIEELEALERSTDENQRDSAARFNAIFDQPAVGMVLSAPNGKWLRTNRKLGDILGYDDGLSGLSFRAIFHADDLDAHLALLEKLTANEVPFTEIEARLVRKDGSITWGFITTSLQRDTEGAPAYFLTVVENIWRRADLMREVAERQRIEDELRRAKDVADKANQAKSEFLSTMSHELRTPMNAILGFAQMLELNPRMPLTEDQKTYVDHITSGGRHLVRLIDQVLDLAKIEAGMMTLSIERIQGHL